MPELLPVSRIGLAESTDRGLVGHAVQRPFKPTVQARSTGSDVDLRRIGAGNSCKPDLTGRVGGK